MYAKLYGATLHGIEGCVITVEVDISQGLPVLDIVGLPNQSVKEARERVRAAIKNSGYEFPMRRIVVNLAPANIRKSSAGLDLAIAIGIILASGQIKGRKKNLQSLFERCICMGKLALDGTILTTYGTLAMALCAMENNCRTVYTNPVNGHILEAIPNLTVHSETTLQGIISLIESHAKGCQSQSDDICNPVINTDESYVPVMGEYAVDFGDVRGQDLGKRAMMLSAAGHHHCIMVGPPGAGKTMMAERLLTILPPMSWSEIVEVSRIQDVLGLLGNEGLVKTRPFRHPHHTATVASMVGGGISGKPGEITLAHGGVLFMDEAPEFQRQVIEALRQPLESRTITINRSQGNYIYPADCICIFAANPCPCGYYNDPYKECLCSQTDIHNYQRRLSGPIMDRIDLHIPVERPTLEHMLDTTYSSMDSESMRHQVVEAVALQGKRYEGLPFNSNGQLPHRAIRELCNVTDSAWHVLGTVFERFHMSGRAFDRILRVSRTIADLEGNPEVEEKHISEAMMFRSEQ